MLKIKTCLYFTLLPITWNHSFAGCNILGMKKYDWSVKVSLIMGQNLGLDVWTKTNTQSLQVICEWHLISVCVCTLYHTTLEVNHASSQIHHSKYTFIFTHQSISFCYAHRGN